MPNAMGSRTKSDQTCRHMLRWRKAGLAVELSAVVLTTCWPLRALQIHQVSFRVRLSHVRAMQHGMYTCSYSEYERKPFWEVFGRTDLKHRLSHWSCMFMTPNLLISMNYTCQSYLVFCLRFFHVFFPCFFLFQLRSHKKLSIVKLSCWDCQPTIDTVGPSPLGAAARALVVATGLPREK